MRKKAILKIGCYLVFGFFAFAFAFSVIGGCMAVSKKSPEDVEGDCIDRLFEGRNMQGCTENKTKLVVDEKK